MKEKIPANIITSSGTSQIFQKNSRGASKYLESLDIDIVVSTETNGQFPLVDLLLERNDKHLINLVYLKPA